jgi:urease accessory protein
VDADAYSLRKRLVPLVQLLNQGAALPKCWSL